MILGEFGAVFIIVHAKGQTKPVYVRDNDSIFKFKDWLTGTVPTFPANHVIEKEDEEYTIDNREMYLLPGLLTNGVSLHIELLKESGDEALNKAVCDLLAH
jgi:hypothetical protein